nr:hypothetical protein [Burkholderiales bacterium]MBP9769622.1 hypothetical protein [Burkholderiales bacterium]
HIFHLVNATFTPTPTVDYWASLSKAKLPDVVAYYVIPVRHNQNTPFASFRFYLTVNTLA